ncbi:AtpZ/AtpI family protein [Candidatus Peregrinibacteria bacterium]|nr:AtpZ/AtpI family protein [Candidatus Peregrinibacteria bacterium]
MGNKEQKSEAAKKTTFWMMLGFAWQLGYVISLPIVILGFGGAYADKYFGTSPLFILIGIVAAVSLTSVGLYYKIKKMIM